MITLTQRPLTPEEARRVLEASPRRLTVRWWGGAMLVVTIFVFGCGSGIAGVILGFADHDAGSPEVPVVFQATWIALGVVALALLFYNAMSQRRNWRARRASAERAIEAGVVDICTIEFEDAWVIEDERPGPTRSSRVSRKAPRVLLLRADDTRFVEVDEKLDPFLVTLLCKPVIPPGAPTRTLDFSWLPQTGLVLSWVWRGDAIEPSGAMQFDQLPQCFQYQTLLDNLPADLRSPVRAHRDGPTPPPAPHPPTTPSA